MEEKRYLLNVCKSPVDTRDWKASAIFPTIDLPPSIDYRPMLQPIRDQGNQGSCAAMAGAAMKECQEYMDSGLDEYLSPQFIYNLRDGEDEGMYMRDLMNILRKSGVCTEKVFPYGSYGLPSQTALNEAKKYIIKSYAAVNSLEELKTALFLNGPCVIAVPVYNFTERMWYQRPGDEILGGHAIDVVSFDDNTRKCWVRNSWGKYWGQEGYCELSYDDFDLIRETWTTVDEKYIPPNPDPEPEPEKSWFKRFWWIIPIVIAITVLLIILT